jgi:hypothetical protein
MFPWCLLVTNVQLTVLRVEWAKSRARALRWKEEVMLLKEEMRRVRRFLEWKANWWQSRSDGWDGLDVSIAAGIKAYAFRQRNIQQALLTEFTRLWEVPLTSCGVTEDAGEGEEAVNQAWSAIADQLEADSDDEDDS